MPHALAALLLLLVALPVLSYYFLPWHGMRAAVSTAARTEGLEIPQDTRSPLLRNIVGASVAVFLLSCLLGGTSPLGIDAALCAQIAIVTASVSLYKFGLHRIEQQNWRRNPSRPYRGPGSYSNLNILSFPYPVLALWVDHALVNVTAAVSPIVAYFNLTPWLQSFARRTQDAAQWPWVFHSPAPWWMSPTLQVPFALACLAAAKWMSHLGEVKKAERKPVRWMDPLVERSLALLARLWDNAVTSKEIRVRTRRSGLASFSATLVVYLIIWTVALIWPHYVSRIPDSLPWTFFSRGLQGSPKVAATMILLMLLSAGVMSLMFVIGTASFAFASEFRKGTWQGVALTPLQHWEIALGKLMPSYLAAAMAVALASPFVFICLLIAFDLSVVGLATMGLVWIFVQTFTIAALCALTELWHRLLKWLPATMIVVIIGAHIFVPIVLMTSSGRQGGVSVFQQPLWLAALIAEGLFGLLALVLVIERVAASRCGDIVVEGAVPN